MQARKYIPLFVIVLLVSCSSAALGQCAMCKGTVQTSAYAKSINQGIEYMLLAPILLVAAVAFLWIKNKDKFQTKEN